MDIKKTIAVVATKTPMPTTIPVDATKVAFDTLVSAWKECTIVSEQEQTKRENIKANRDVNVKAIEENSAILKLYLEKTFTERATTIQGMFERLDEGLKSGNTEVIALTIGAIIDITKQSPLAGARELLANYHDPNVKSIEI